MDRQRFGYCGHENKNINMQSIKIGKSFFYNPAAAWFPRPQASHRVPFVWNFASDALEIMNIECLAFMIRPNFKRLQKSLKSQVNWSYQLENLIQKWMRRSEHSYFQKCHRLSKVPRRDISQLTTGQTFRNVKLIRIFFFKDFFLLCRSDGQVPYTDATARGPMRQDCCDCYRYCLHKCSPTSPQQNVNFESYQTKTRLSTWIRSLLKFTKEKKTQICSGLFFLLWGLVMYFLFAYIYLIDFHLRICAIYPWSFGAMIQRGH